jgi:sulfur carrier protein
VLLLKIILPDGRCQELQISEATVEDVLRDLGVNPVEVIVSKNGKVVSELESIGQDDEMKIIRIVHGG